MCINDPIKGELKTDIKIIKEVSLKHNVKILTKNKLREQDMEELKDKEENHKKIMAINNKDEWELDKKLYRKVLERIKKKGKWMFNLLNNAGEKYKRKIIQKEQIPFQFSYTSIIPIWKKRLSTGLKNYKVCTLQRMGNMVL